MKTLAMFLNIEAIIIHRIYMTTSIKKDSNSVFFKVYLYVIGFFFSFPLPIYLTCKLFYMVM